MYLDSIYSLQNLSRDAACRSLAFGFCSIHIRLLSTWHANRNKIQFYYILNRIKILIHKKRHNLLLNFWLYLNFVYIFLSHLLFLVWFDLMCIYFHLEDNTANKYIQRHDRTRHGISIWRPRSQPMTQQSPNAAHMSFVLHYLHLPRCFNIKLNEDDNKFIGWPFSRCICICIGCIFTFPYIIRRTSSHHPTSASSAM